MSTDPTATHGEPASTPSTDPTQPNWGAYNRFAMLAGIAGIALFVIVGGVNFTAADGEPAKNSALTRFVSAYLAGFTFWLSLPIGGMSLLLIAHLTKTSWGLLLRRPLEAATRTLPLTIVLWVPLAIAVATNTASPYWWTHPEDMQLVEGPTLEEITVQPGDNKRERAVQTGKAMINRTVLKEREEREEGTFHFLSPKGFIGVSIVLFSIWGGMIFFLNKFGKEAATATTRAGVEAALEKANKFAGPGLIVYGITITAAATLWVMSVEPSWSSTMFPVIFAVNQFLTCFAFCVALFLLLANKPPFAGVMRPKFQLDMGTLMLVFTLFWSYTSFSQFMLVWVGNLPEEIPFFLKRSTGGWFWVSAGLCVFHFAVPFLLLLFRDIKLHPARLRAVAVYLLGICAIDVVWWIEPSIKQTNAFPFWLMDIGAIAGIGGVWGLFFLYQLKQRSLLPLSELYRLPEGHEGHHEHH